MCVCASVSKVCVGRQPAKALVAQRVTRGQVGTCGWCPRGLVRRARHREPGGVLVGLLWYTLIRAEGSFEQLLIPLL